MATSSGSPYGKRTIATMETGIPALPSPLRFQSLASGSSGNAYLLQSGPDTILIDCGVGIRQITAVCNDWGANDRNLSAVVITHEHGDHVRSLDAVKRRGGPIHATSGTANALGLADSRYTRLRHLEPLTIGSIEVIPVPVSHDAAEPAGVLLVIGKVTIGVITDTGEVTDTIAELAARCDLLVLESNHDREMLRLGPYPSYLKTRVGGRHGHLSNDQAAGMISEVVTESSGPAEVWLGHLSATNNTPTVALSTTNLRLQKVRQSVPVRVLPRGSAGPLWTGPRVRTRQLELMVDP
jgi:phosphoribosyl 1,2-cyclic phosphodiesterase